MHLSLRAFLPAALLLVACTAQTVPSEDTQLKEGNQPQAAATLSSSSVSTAPQAPKPDLAQSYTHKTDKYSIHFPEGWTVKEKAASPLTYRKSAGTSFITPDGYETDTTLVLALVFVERTRKPCVQFVNATDVILAGRQMQKGDSTTLGTKYYTRNTMYTLATDSACFSIMLTARACNAGDDCGDEHLNTFDPTELNKIFEQIVTSFKPL